MSSIKDNEISNYVDKFREISVKFKDTDQLGAKIREAVNQLVKRCDFLNMKENIIEVLSDVAYLPCDGYCDMRSIDSGQLLSYAEKIIEITKKFGKENSE